MADKGLYYYMDSNRYRSTKIEVLKLQVDLINAIKKVRDIQKINSNRRKLRKSFQDQIPTMREKLYKYEIKMPPIKEVIVESVKQEPKIAPTKKIKEEKPENKKEKKDELTRIREELKRINAQ